MHFTRVIFTKLIWTEFQKLTKGVRCPMVFVKWRIFNDYFSCSPLKDLATTDILGVVPVCCSICLAGTRCRLLPASLVHPSRVHFRQVSIDIVSVISSVVGAGWCQAFIRMEAQIVASATECTVCTYICTRLIRKKAREVMWDFTTLESSSNDFFLSYRTDSTDSRTI